MAHPPVSIDFAAIRAQRLAEGLIASATVPSPVGGSPTTNEYSFATTERRDDFTRRVTANGGTWLLVDR